MNFKSILLAGVISAWPFVTYAKDIEVPKEVLPTPTMEADCPKDRIKDKSWVKDLLKNKGYFSIVGFAAQNTNPEIKDGYISYQLILNVDTSKLFFIRVTPDSGKKEIKEICVMEEGFIPPQLREMAAHEEQRLEEYMLQHQGESKKDNSDSDSLVPSAPKSKDSDNEPKKDSKPDTTDDE